MDTTNPVPVHRIPAVQWSCRGTFSYAVDKHDSSSVPSNYSSSSSIPTMIIPNSSSLTSSRTKLYHRQPLLELYPEIRDPSVYIPSRAVAGINLDINNNIHILNNEIAASSTPRSSVSNTFAQSSSTPLPQRSAHPFSYVLQPGDPQTEQIRIMYQWLQRIETSLRTLSSLTTSTVPAQCIQQQIIFEQIASSSLSGISVTTTATPSSVSGKPMVSTEVPCGSLTAFTHPLRTAALTLCGWSPLASLMDGSKLYPSNTIVHDSTTHRPVSSIEAVAAAVPIPLIRLCCEMGQVERAAAIALLHGYSGVAVQLLQLAADDIRYNYALSLQSSETKYYGPHPSHAELLQLTAMAVAGCPGPATAEDEIPSFSSTPFSSSSTSTTHQQRNATRDIWLTSCRSLMTRIDGRWHPYLKVMLTVLVEVADPALVTTPIQPTAEPVGSHSTVRTLTDSNRKMTPLSPNTIDYDKSERKVRYRPMHRVDTLFSYNDAHSTDPSLPLSTNYDIPTTAQSGTPVFNSPYSGTHSIYASPRISAQTSPNIPSWGRETPRNSESPFITDTIPAATQEEEHIEISLHDRVAFACRFLDDARLPEYIARITGECITTGRIDGLLLTGLSPYGTILLQNYIDNTGDVQTGAIVAHYFLRFAQIYLLHRVKFSSSSDEQVSSIPTSRGTMGTLPSTSDLRTVSLTKLLPLPVQQMVCMCWRYIQSYRSFLNQLQLWQYRAKIDVQRALFLGYQHNGGRKTNNNNLTTGSTTGMGGTVSGLSSSSSLFPSAYNYGSSSDTVSPVAPSSVDHTSFNLLEFEHQSYLTLVGLVEDTKGKENTETVLADTPTNNSLPSIGYFLVRPPTIVPTTSVTNESLGSTNGIGSSGSINSLMKPIILPPSGRLIQSLLPSTNQLYVKCPSCRISLHLPSLVENSATAVEWLSKQRPHLISCPSCRKHLPRCELCLLPMGVINPVLQLQYEMVQRNNNNHNVYSLLRSGGGLPSSASSSILPLSSSSSSSSNLNNPSVTTGNTVSMFPTTLSTFQTLNGSNNGSSSSRSTNDGDIPDINYSKIMDEGINIGNTLIDTNPAVASSSSLSSSSSESSSLLSTSEVLRTSEPENPLVTLISERITGSGVGLLGPMAMSPSGRLRDAVRMDELWCWCQSCHHGGHTSHLLDWFTTKTVCPVAQCMCHCIKQDSAYASALGIIPTIRINSEIN